ncbi:DedA family protein [Microbacterium xylanilyticum]
MHLLASSVLAPAGLLPDATSMLHAFGPWVLAGIALLIFIESGVLFPFLPGDSLLVTAAILAGPLGIQPWQVLLVGIPAAVLGDQVGYVLGKRYGRRLFRDDARVLRTSRLVETERFFERYGPLSLVLGRFVPIVRTYVPLVAGTARLPYRRFLPWNAIGAVAWVCGMTAIGLLLGGIPGVVDNIDLLMIAIVVVSVVPVAIGGVRGMLRARRQREDAAQVSRQDRVQTAADPDQAGVPSR